MAENHALLCRNLVTSFFLACEMQRELYPSLLLFPAGRKKAVPYGGDMAVSNIINFLAHHGSHFYDLPQEKGEFPDFKIFVVAHHPSE
ncbi:hypothetical protein MTR67_006883 [Solanum verrucosum]|uniref:Uncharacterized protein n=1 Tax=Solanum verrucosum TaxID=315347 RepID=A0AAF0PYP7_SOLVR|nr:hypothetical protein MTR67_006883 [Solanum verrucosum]